MCRLGEAEDEIIDIVSPDYVRPRDARLQTVAETMDDRYPRERVTTVSNSIQISPLVGVGPSGWTIGAE